MSNKLKDLYPDLFNEIDQDKNKSEGVIVDNITYGSGKKIWWKCHNCQSSYEATPKLRTRRRDGCSYCRGLKVNHTNSLAVKNPSLAKEYHRSKNLKSIHEVTEGSREKVWWVGKCGHEWEARISRRKQGDGCPYCCSNPKTLKDYNDIRTTHPVIASWIKEPHYSTTLSIGSTKKIDWVCPTCQNIISKKSPDLVGRRGLSCRQCGDGFSVGEKMVYNILKSMQENFETEKTFIWSQGKRYDFYLAEKNIIIEVHGGQHYFQKGFSKLGGRTLLQEQENDAIKKDLARQNGIEHYIIIDARHSEPKFLQKSIEASLSSIINLKNCCWSDIIANSLMSFFHPIIERLKDGQNAEEIAIDINKSIKTTKNYIRIIKQRKLL